MTEANPSPFSGTQLETVPRLARELESLRNIVLKKREALEASLGETPSEGGFHAARTA